MRALILVAGLFMAGLAHAAIYVVNPEGSGDYPTIQAAVDACVNGDEVALTDGTFTGPGNRDISFMGKAITVRAGSGNPQDCLIDCEGGYPSSLHRAFHFYSGEGRDSRLEGITITGGYQLTTPAGENGGGAIFCELESSPLISNCILRDNFCLLGGACLFKSGAAPWIEDCTFLRNVSWGGGGLFICEGASPEVQDCLFAENEARYEFNYGFGGGAICALEGSIDLLRCRFKANEAEGWGGGVRIGMAIAHIDQCIFEGNSSSAVTAGMGATLRMSDTEISATVGSGLVCAHCELVDVERTIFRDNSAYESGGGVYIHDASATFRQSSFENNSCPNGGGAVDAQNASVAFTNSSFTNNSSNNTSGGLRLQLGDCTLTDCTLVGNAGYLGGGLQVDAAELTLTRVTFHENIARVGGALFAANANPEINDCTIAGNHGAAGSGALRLWDSSPRINWTLIAFNTGGQAVQGNDGSRPRFRRCDIYGNEGGDWIGYIANQSGVYGNISADPLFCDLAAGDLALHRDSPCARAMDMLHDAIGAHEIGCGSARTALVGAEGIALAGLQLAPCQPNPFGRTTLLSFTIPPTTGVAPATLTIHDPSGRRVREWQIADAGTHAREWDGTDQQGRSVLGGVYFCRLMIGEESVVKRVTLLR